MSETKELRVSINLTGPDAELAEQLRIYLEKRLGKLSSIQVARLAYRTLAEKEGL